MASLAAYFGEDFAPFVGRTSEFLIESFQRNESEDDVRDSCAAFALLAESQFCGVGPIAELVIGMLLSGELSAEMEGCFLGTIVVCLEYHFAEMAPFVEPIVTFVRAIVEAAPDSILLDPCLGCLVLMMKNGVDELQELAFAALSCLQGIEMIDGYLLERAFDVVAFLAKNHAVQVVEFDAQTEVINRTLGAALDEEDLREAASDLLQLPVLGPILDKIGPIAADFEEEEDHLHDRV
jgi:hypothetical protein